MGKSNSTPITFLQCKDCLESIQTTEKAWSFSTSGNLLTCLLDLYDHIKKVHGYDLRTIAECSLHGSWLIGQQNMSAIAVSYYAKELHSFCSRVLDHPEDRVALDALNSVCSSGITQFLKALQAKKDQARWNLLLFAMLSRLWSSNSACACLFLTTVLREDYVVFEDGDSLPPSEAKKIFLQILGIAGDDFFYAYKALDVDSKRPTETFEEKTHKIPLATVRKEMKDIVSGGRIIGVAIPEPLGIGIYAKAIFGGCVLANTTRIRVFEKDDVITVASMILIYVHEYVHPKSIIHCLRNDWLQQLRQGIDKNETGEFATFNALKLDTEEYVLILKEMNKELAVFLVEPMNWANLTEMRKRLRIFVDKVKVNTANTGEITTRQQTIGNFLAVYNSPKAVKMGCCMFSPECYKKRGNAEADME